MKHNPAGSEDLNGKIGTLQRNACDCQNKDHLRLRIYTVDTNPHAFTK